jgi:predicted nicotinamide N-methyase
VSDATARDDARALERSLRTRFDVVDADVEIGARHFTLLRPRDAEALISEDDFARDERLPYWADVWPSSLVLAERLAAERPPAGATLLELGCGLGVVALAAASAGFDVTVSDYYEDALDFARVNLARAGQPVRARLLDWRALPDDLPRHALVVASDVLYEKPYAQLVADVLARTVAPAGRAIVADPGRLAAPDFALAARRAGFAIDESDVRRIDVGGITQRIRLYTLRWNGMGSDSIHPRRA